MADVFHSLVGIQGKANDIVEFQDSCCTGVAIQLNAMMELDLKKIIPMPPTIQSKEVGDEARESWCRENWGCGETYEIDNEVGDEDVRVWLAFYTEGGSPEKALLEMAKRFPRLEFVILCSVDKAPPLSRWHLRAGKIVCQHYSGDLDEKGSRAGESRHERRRREKARRRVRGSRKFVYI